MSVKQLYPNYPREKEPSKIPVGVTYYPIILPRLTAKEKETLEILIENALKENPFALYGTDKNVVNGFNDANSYLSYRLHKIYSLEEKGYIRLYKVFYAETHRWRTVCLIPFLPKKGWVK